MTTVKEMRQAFIAAERIRMHTLTNAALLDEVLESVGATEGGLHGNEEHAWRDSQTARIAERELRTRLRECRFLPDGTEP